MKKKKANKGADISAFSAIIGGLQTRLAGMFGVTHNGARDLYNVFGYERFLTVNRMLALYQRNDIAARIVDAYPSACWREPAKVYDGKEGSTWGEDVHKMITAINGWGVLLQADKISTIGRYGIILVGIADNRDVGEPAGEGELAYLSAYGEDVVDISMWEQDPTSPRFGMPKMYSVQIGQGEGSTAASRYVHWSRVIHICENPLIGNVFGTPRLERVANRLTDLEKILGGSAEAFWLNARAGIVGKTQPDANISEADMTAIMNDVESYQHQLNRVLMLSGLDLEFPNIPVADPSPHVDMQLKVIAGAVGIPLRILTGSEAGELASTADESNWNSRIQERRENHITPHIIRPLIDLLMRVGAVEQVEDYNVIWDSDTNISEEVRARTALTWAQAVATYANAPSGEFVTPVNEFREVYMGLPPEPEGGFPELPDVPEEPGKGGFGAF